MNTNDADWVEDVRRWYFNGGRPRSVAETKPVAAGTGNDGGEIGYEAAQPSLQSPSWASPAGSQFGLLR